MIIIQTKEEYNKYHREYRLKHRDKLNTKARATYPSRKKKAQKAVKKWSDKNNVIKSKWLNDYKETLVCLHCGFNFDGKPECCDFHHKDPSTKRHNVAQMLNHNCKRIKEEIDKCIAICANCHRILHKGGVNGKNRYAL